MDRDNRLVGAALNRANGLVMHGPAATLRGTMYANNRVMSDQAMFAPDETFQNSRLLDFRRKGTLPPNRREQMNVRRLQFGCAVGHT